MYWELCVPCGCRVSQLGGAVHLLCSDCPFASHGWPVSRNCLVWFYLAGRICFRTCLGLCENTTHSTLLCGPSWVCYSGRPSHQTVHLGNLSSLVRCICLPWLIGLLGSVWGSYCLSARSAQINRKILRIPLRLNLAEVCLGECIFHNNALTRFGKGLFW